MSYIKANLTTIDNKKSNFITKKNIFNNTSYPTFKNGYISTCSDSTVKRMKNKLDGFYKKIESGYSSINNYWDNYVKDFDSLEKSLKNFSASCTNFVVNSNISSYVDSLPKKNTPASSFISLDAVYTNASNGTSTGNTNVGNNSFTDLAVAGFTKAADQLINIDEETIQISQYITNLSDCKAELETELDDLKKKRDELYAKDSELALEDPDWYLKEDGELTWQDYDELIAAKEAEIAEVDYYIKEFQHCLDLKPYLDLQNNEDYQTVLDNYNYLQDNIDYDSMIQANYDIATYKNITGSTESIDVLSLAEYIKNNAPEGMTIEEVANMFPNLQIVIDGEVYSVFDFYMFLPEEEKDIYHYIFVTQGEEAANQYLKLLVDDVNKAKGTYEANKFIEDFDYYYSSETDGEGVEKALGMLASTFDVSKQGLGDGINSFFDGMDEVLKNNGNLTAEDYKKAVILQYLKENAAVYGDVYEFNTSLGNMLPIIATSAIASVIATPAAGEALGTALMGLSCYGNAKHQALASGAGKVNANLYGLLSGCSEALLEKFIGGIPGISNEASLGITSLLREGGEEFIQEYIDAGLRCALLGEEIDINNLNDDAMKSFFMGVCMAGVLNGGQEAIIITIDGVDYVVNSKSATEVYNMLKNNKGKVDANAILSLFKNNNSDSSVDTTSVLEYYKNLPDGRKGAPQFIFTMAVERNITKNIEEYVKVVQKYHPELTREEAIKFIGKIGESGPGESGGICDYAAYTNVLTEEFFKDNPELFKEIYGVEYYTTNSIGQKMARDDLILLDLYCYLNMNKIQNGKYVSSYKTRVKEIGNTDRTIIENYLKSKGINCKITEEKIYNNYSVVKWQCNNDISGEAFKDFIKNSINQALKDGKYANITVNIFDNSTLTYRDLDGNILEISDENDTGHVMSIVGVDGDYLLVLNQGRLCKLEISELEKISVDIRTVEVKDTSINLTEDISNAPKYNQGISTNNTKITQVTDPTGTNNAPKYNQGISGMLGNNKGKIDYDAILSLFKKNKGDNSTMKTKIEPFNMSSETINNYKELEEFLLDIDPKSFDQEIDMMDSEPEHYAELLANKYGGDKSIYLDYIDNYLKTRESLKNRLKKLNYGDPEIDLILYQASPEVLNKLLNNEKNDSILKDLCNETVKELANGNKTKGSFELANLITRYQDYEKKLSELDSAIASLPKGKKHTKSLEFLRKNAIFTGSYNGRFEKYYTFQYGDIIIEYPMNMKNGYDVEIYLKAIEEIEKEHPALKNKVKKIVFNEKQLDDKKSIMYTKGNWDIHINPLSKLFAKELKGTLVHEMTHNFDKYGDIEFFYSSSEEYLEAFDADGNYTSDYAKDYAMNNSGDLREDFAEATYYLELNGRKKFEKKFPNRAEYFKKNFPDLYYSFSE